MWSARSRRQSRDVEQPQGVLAPMPRAGMATPAELADEWQIDGKTAGTKLGDVPQTKGRLQRRAEWLAKAMLLVQDSPEWSDAEIARRVKKNKSTLMRSREYQTAAALARKADARAGRVIVDPKTKQQSVEGIADDDGEEARDARIDAEMAAPRNATRNAKIKKGL